MIRLSKYRLTFLFIPKTGTTSLRKFLVDNILTSSDLIYEQTHISKRQAIDLKLSTSHDTFTATIRNPLEVQLSRYLYYSNLGKIQNQSPSDFQNRIISGNGFLNLGESWELKPQHSFIDSTDWLWCYDNLNTHCLELLEQCNIEYIKPLDKLNKATSIFSSSSLMMWYYTPDTKKLAETYHRKDLDLYNSVKHRNLQ